MTDDGPVSARTASPSGAPRATALGPTEPGGGGRCFRRRPATRHGRCPRPRAPSRRPPPRRRSPRSPDLRAEWRRCHVRRATRSLWPPVEPGPHWRDARMAAFLVAPAHQRVKARLRTGSVTGRPCVRQRVRGDGIPPRQLSLPCIHAVAVQRLSRTPRAADVSLTRATAAKTTPSPRSSRSTGRSRGLRAPRDGHLPGGPEVGR